MLQNLHRLSANSEVGAMLHAICVIQQCNVVLQTSNVQDTRFCIFFSHHTPSSRSQHSTTLLYNYGTDNIILQPANTKPHLHSLLTNTPEILYLQRTVSRHTRNILEHNTHCKQGTPTRYLWCRTYVIIASFSNTFLLT